MIVRPEREEETSAIWRVNAAAFGRAAEADLVDALRERGAALISLVAEVDGEIVGHILFSPVVIEGESETRTAVALGPLAVLPAYQGQGIGSRLVLVGLEACRQAGQGVVIVLGHPSYYPRFGFVPASRHGIRWDRDVPDDVFMVAELLPGALEGVQGIVHYRPEFDAV